MPLYEINRKRPHIGTDTWIAPNAHVIGEVTIGASCFIGFGAVIRADFGPIIIGSETAVEDNVVIHTATRTEIGNCVIIGHMAMIHDAKIGDRSLIGMKSMICEGAVIGEGAIVAEQSLVGKNQCVPPKKIVAGSPAVEIRNVEPRHAEHLKWGARIYAELAGQYRKGLKQIR